MTEDEARDQLRRMVASDTFPTLDGYELTDLLRLARRPDRWGILDVGIPLPPDYVGFNSNWLPYGYERTQADGDYAVWAPSTDYALGKMVVPRRRTGEVYVCQTAGTSGADDPAWPKDGTVTDGTVVWAESDVIVWQPTYDLNFAAAEGWRWKAGKTTDHVTFGTQGDNYNAEQLHTHCMDMAKYYEARTGSRSLKTRTARTRPIDMLRLPRAN